VPAGSGGQAIQNGRVLCRLHEAVADERYDESSHGDLRRKQSGQCPVKAGDPLQRNAVTLHDSGGRGAATVAS